MKCHITKNYLMLVQSCEDKETFASYVIVEENTGYINIWNGNGKSYKFKFSDFEPNEVEIYPNFNEVECLGHKIKFGKNYEVDVRQLLLKHYPNRITDEVKKCHNCNRQYLFSEEVDQLLSIFLGSCIIFLVISILITLINSALIQNN